MPSYYMERQLLLTASPNIDNELLFWNKEKEQILFTTALKEENNQIYYIKALTEDSLRILDYFFDFIGFYSIFDDIDNNYTEEILKDEVFYFDDEIDKWTTKSQVLERLKLFEL